MRGLCVAYVWLGQTLVNGNTTNLERVLYLCLALDWRWSDVLLASTFTRGKTLTFFNMQKMCAEVDAHNKWITFIRRSRQFFNELWRTPDSFHFISDARPANHNALTKGGGPRVVVSTAAFHARVRGSVPGLGGLKETKTFLPRPRVKVSIVGSLRDREVACSASDRQGPNFESCVWRTVSSQSSHHPQEVLLAQFSLYVHKGGLKPDSFHFLHWPKFFILLCAGRAWWYVWLSLKVGCAYYSLYQRLMQEEHQSDYIIQILL